MSKLDLAKSMSKLDLAKSLRGVSTVDILVEVPENVNAGDEFSINHMGRNHTIQVPDGAGPGDTLQIRLEHFNAVSLDSYGDSPVNEIGRGQLNRQESSGFFSVPSLLRLRSFGGSSASNGSGDRSAMFYRHGQVTIPEGVQPGGLFQVTYEGFKYIITCPKDAKPGDSMYVDLRLKPSREASSATLLTNQDSIASLPDAGQLFIPQRDYNKKKRGFWEDIWTDIKEAYNSSQIKALFILLLLSTVGVTMSSFGVAVILLRRKDILFSAEVDLVYYDSNDNLDTILPSDAVTTLLELYPADGDNVFIPFECCDSNSTYIWDMQKGGLTTTFSATRNTACNAYQLQLNGLDTNITLNTTVSGAPTEVDNWEFAESSGIEICFYCGTEDRTFFDAGTPVCLAKVTEVPNQSFRLGIAAFLLFLPLIYIYLKVQILGMRPDTEVELMEIKDEFKCCCNKVGLHDMKEVARILTANAFMIGFTYIQLAPDGTLFYVDDLPYLLQTLVTAMSIVGVYMIIVSSFDTICKLGAPVALPFHYIYLGVTFYYCCKNTAWAAIRLNGWYIIDPNAPKVLRRDLVIDMILILVFVIGLFAVGRKMYVALEEDLLEGLTAETLFEGLLQSFFGINPVGLRNINFDTAGGGALSAFTIGAILVLSFSILNFLTAIVSTINSLFRVSNEVDGDKEIEADVDPKERSRIEADEQRRMRIKHAERGLGHHFPKGQEDI